MRRMTTDRRLLELLSEEYLLENGSSGGGGGKRGGGGPRVIFRGSHRMSLLPVVPSLAIVPALSRIPKNVLHRRKWTILSAHSKSISKTPASHSPLAPNEDMQGSKRRPRSRCPRSIPTRKSRRQRFPHPCGRMRRPRPFSHLLSGGDGKKRRSGTI